MKLTKITLFGIKVISVTILCFTIIVGERLCLLNISNGNTVVQAIYPTPEQAKFLNAQFGAVRFAYNKALHIKKTGLPVARKLGNATHRYSVMMELKHQQSQHGYQTLLVWIWGWHILPSNWTQGHTGITGGGTRRFRPWRPT